MKFQDYKLSDQLKKGLSKCGYARPTDIQFKSIPPILNGEDVLAIAQTGTGKTAAFAIPILQILQDRHRNRRTKGVRCLIMVPTRELAIQINEEFNKIAQLLPLKIASLYGGVEQESQINRLAKNIDIVISTPGRMFDLSSQGHLDLSRVEILVLDEADHMLNLGFIKDIEDVVKRIPFNRQTLFFSATIDKKIKDIAYSLVRNAIRIQISPKDPVSKNVNHTVTFIEMDDKRFFLERIINEHPESKILVFVRTKVRVERVVKAMERIGIEAAAIHGGLQQNSRFNVMKQFKSGAVKILIATDVSARGIDIPNVDYVVNYDLPDVPENYVHRVGRTGRGNNKGFAVSFCSSGEKPLLKEIETFVSKPIKVLEIDKQTYRETIDLTDDHDSNWKHLMKMDALEKGQMRNPKKKFKKK